MFSSPVGDTAATVSPDAVGWWLSGLPVPPHTLLARRPNFLVVSAPKTGSTWLAANLRAHPDVFVPPAKELKYFSSLFKWLDLNWYLEQFAPGEGQVKGEASPSYAILPTARIRLLRRLIPDLKLIFLLREPIARAWSHAKHTHRYREATFAGNTSDFAAVTAADWQANFAHDWLTTSGDYLGQLQRWLSVFPREQVYVGFHESIAARPAELLRDIFAFLGVDPGVDLAGFPAHERILPGPSGELSPELHSFLHRQWHARTVELAEFLGTRLGLTPPPEWSATLRPPQASIPPGVPAFDHASDDYLSKVLEHEEDFPTVPASVLPAYLGYDIVFTRGRLLAVARHLGEAELPAGVQGADEATLRRLQESGDCHVAPTLSELKERVALHVAERTEARTRHLEAKLDEARDRVARLEAKMEVALAAARRLEILETEAVRVTPRELVLLERLRRIFQKLVRAWRWVRSIRFRFAAARIVSGEPGA